MKTLFVPVSGTSTDAAVFATALTAAMPLDRSRIWLEHLARQLTWNGIKAETRTQPPTSGVTRELLSAAELPVFLMH